jgi:hypothetical protein
MLLVHPHEPTPRSTDVTLPQDRRRRLDHRARRHRRPRRRQRRRPGRERLVDRHDASRSRPRGGHELTTAQLQSIASKLGVTTTQLQAAIAANRPARPTGARTDRRDGMATELATALGADATKVASILEANRPARPSAPPSSSTQRPAKPDDSALVTALASGLNLEQSAVQVALAKVQAAHQAEHEARDAARYAALAKTLGVDAAKVKAAFEAVRPAPPAGR